MFIIENLINKLYIILIIFANFFKIILSKDFQKVEDYYLCKDKENEDYSSPEEWDNYAFQTPPRFDIMGNTKIHMKIWTILWVMFGLNILRIKINV